jgi:hypothetical protein
MRAARVIYREVAQEYPRLAAGGSRRRGGRFDLHVKISPVTAAAAEDVYTTKYEEQDDDDDKATDDHRKTGIPTRIVGHFSLHPETFWAH